MMTELIVGFPCIGKTSLGKTKGGLYHDMEFRETATTLGMDEYSMDKVYGSYCDIIKEVMNTNYYDYLFVTDNYKLVDKLIKNGLTFKYVVPNPYDKEFILDHMNRVIDRNDLGWYKRIIVPRLIKLEDEINKVNRVKGCEVIFLSKDAPYLKDILV